MNTPSDESKPFVAPCRKLTAEAPLRWLRLGWQDFLRSPGPSSAYGAFVFLISATVTAMAWWLGRYVLVLAMLSGFIFIAPLLASGLYSVSRQLQRGERPTISRAMHRTRMALSNAMIFALILLIIFLVWARAASMVHIFFPASGAGGVDLISFLMIGSAVGSIFAVVTFSVSAFSLPMIVDRDTDMVTACVTSVNAVLNNKGVMVLWAGWIVLITGLSFATAGAGLIIAMPVLGYAAYHGYVETIDATNWSPAP